MIVFDLDGTLIDTTGAVIPFKMELCLKKLETLGLPLVDFSSAYKRLMEINAKSLRSLDALKEFLIECSGEMAWISLLKETLSSPLPDNFAVPTLPFAHEILEELSLTHTLALVTAGSPPFQREKLKKAGIEPGLFSKILIPEDCGKKPSYEALCKQFLKKEVIVCGDRVEIDLLPAYELGFATVHMRWGRGLLNQTESWVDYSICDLRELRNIVQ